MLALGSPILFLAKLFFTKILGLNLLLIISTLAFYQKSSTDVSMVACVFFCFLTSVSVHKSFNNLLLFLCFTLTDPKYYHQILFNHYQAFYLHIFLLSDSILYRSAFDYFQALQYLIIFAATATTLCSNSSITTFNVSCLPKKSAIKTQIHAKAQNLNQNLQDYNFNSFTSTSDSFS